MYSYTKRSWCFLIVVFQFAISFLNAQTKSGLKGSVSDGQNTLWNATIVISPIGLNLKTNQSGDFSAALPPGNYTIQVSFVGFQTYKKNYTILADSILNLAIKLLPLVSTESEVVILGSRSSSRSSFYSSLPIDIIRLSELQNSGQPSLDKQLQFCLPSFNTVNMPVSDANTLLDPYEIRNLGPTRTLILINGKRKNPSSLVYLFPGADRGETGADLSAIPTEAIKRVEVLRDGASAQYGSDAIAGVINIILKNDTSNHSLNLLTGITHKGDGFSKELSYQVGSAMNKKGSLNLTLGFNQTSNAIRSGKVDLSSEKSTFGGNPNTDAAIEAYLRRYPNANNLNGTGATLAGKILINTEYPINDNSTIFFNSAFCIKQVISNANFRTPYWRTDAGLLHSRIPGAPNYTGTGDPLYEGYLGYLPSFEGGLYDYHSTFGYNIQKGKWKHEASISVGGNQQLYDVNNTVNPSLGTASPTSFKAGGYDFKQLVGNYDITSKLNEHISLAIGSEIRGELYRIIAGDTASYFGEGANSFPGISQNNQSQNRRYNVGVYTDLSWDINSNFLINGAARIENYSDFGNAFVWKLSSRYSFANDKIILRGALSNGFRAPTMHQLYTQTTSAFYSNGNITLGGLFNNGSNEVKTIGIPSLQPENSRNFSIGFGWKPTRSISFTLDYYKINIDNRIILSNPISTNDPSTLLYQILNQSNIGTIQFFTNGINTRTEGLDFIFSYGFLTNSVGQTEFTLAGNWTMQNKIVGELIEPEAIRASNVSILDAGFRSFIETSRPRNKVILGVNQGFRKLALHVNHTWVGSTRFQDLSNGGLIMQHITQKFKKAMLTDLNIRWNIHPKIKFSVSVNNIFNVIPRWDLVALDPNGKNFLSDPLNRNLLVGKLTFNGRYPIVGYTGSQFSQLGTTFQSMINFIF